MNIILSILTALVLIIGYFIIIEWGLDKIDNPYRFYLRPFTTIISLGLLSYAIFLKLQ